MGIYLPNMEMPPNCFRCPLSVLNGERLFCKATKDEAVRAKRAGDCPLVPVPKHGRLIDADALNDSLGTEDQDCYVHWTLESAPTIIEAEIEKGDTEC